MLERSPEITTFGPFSFDPADGLRRGTEPIAIPPRALAVLGALVAADGQLVSKADLLQAGWRDAFVTDASLLEAIHVLRGALGDDRRAPIYIQTVHRRGYRFIAPIGRTTPGEATPEARPVTGAEEVISPDTGAAVSAEPEVEIFPPFFSGPEWQLIGRRCAQALAATVLTSVLVAISGRGPAESAASRFSIALPSSAEMPSDTGAVAVSADGRRFAFVALDAGRPALFVRDAGWTLPIRVDEAAAPSDPFFSPRGHLLGYFAGGQLKVVELGKPPHAITPVVAGAGATWIDDTTIVFGGGPGGGLARVSITGGAPDVLLQPQASTPHVRYGWPSALPDGAGLLFTVLTPTGSDVAYLDSTTATHRVLVRDAAFGRYAASGHLVVQQNGRLTAASFDPVAGRLTGGLRPVVDDVASADPFEGPRFAFSESGALVYVPGGMRPALDVSWNRAAAERSGAFETRLSLVPAASGPLSPVENPQSDAAAVSPASRGDGLEVAFAANKTGPYNLFVQQLGGRELPLDPSPWNQLPTSWSPDGRRIAFTEFHPATGADIWVLDRQSRHRRVLARTPYDESGARFSPDGQWVAYLSRGAGEWDVVVVPAAGGSAKARVPARRLIDPKAAGASGRELRIVLAWFSDLTRQMRGPA